MRSRKSAFLLVIVTLLLATLACDRPEQQPTPVSSTEATAPVGDATDTPSPSLEPTEEPTEEPTATATAEEECVFDSEFVSDITIPDGTQFSPGASFIKTWRLRNTGTCPWDAGTELVFSSGNQMGGPDGVLVGAVAVDSTADVSVSMTAPSSPGTYSGNWQLQTSTGTRFGDIPYVEILVPGQSSPTTAPSNTPNPCVAVNAELQPIATHAEDLGYDIGCPTAPASSVYGAFQEYWNNVANPNPNTHLRSLMIWRSDNSEIYVIIGEDTSASEGMILAYTDSWEEGQPDIHPTCASMTPPTGYQMPIRGFGKTWCVNDLESWVGWPALNEIGLDLLIQPTQTGLLLKVSGPITTGYLIALDYRAVHAVTLMTTP